MAGEGDQAAGREEGMGGGGRGGRGGWGVEMAAERTGATSADGGGNFETEHFNSVADEKYFHALKAKHWSNERDCRTAKKIWD